LVDLPCAFKRRFHAGGDGAGVLEQRMHPRQAPGRFRPRRGEDLEAAGGVGDHHVGAGGLGDQACSERFAATEAGAVAGFDALEARLAVPQVGDRDRGLVACIHGLDLNGCGSTVFLRQPAEVDIEQGERTRRL
jgi:hypothetical protein